MNPQGRASGVQRRSVIGSAFGATFCAAVGTLPGLAGCDAEPSRQAGVPDTLARWPTLPVLDLLHQATTLPATSSRARIINVWALWCPPCRRELPGLQRLARSLAPQGVALCALALADDSFAVREYLSQHAPELQGVVLPPRSPAALQLGLNVLPQTFVIAADGRVLARWLGERDWDSSAAREALDALLRSG